MSSNQLIKIRDRVTAIEAAHVGGFRGEVIFGKGRHDVHYIDPYGRPAVRSEFDVVLDKGRNIVPIGGYQFAFDKLFNIGLDQESTLRVGDLNDEAPMMKIGVQRANYRGIYYNTEVVRGAPQNIPSSEMQEIPGINIPAMNYIFGFMIGDGGCKEDNITPIAPDYKNRSLYHAIPFRKSDDNLEGLAAITRQKKYYGMSKTLKQGAGQSITSFYVKKFDDPKPRIVHCWVTDNPNELEIVDDTVFASTSSLAIESYVEMNLTVSPEDARGYFYNNDSGSTPRVNEFALVSGWYNPYYEDYEALRMFTHFTRPSISLAEGDSIEAIYRLYSR